mmetsp:Transcript_93372/g.302229  ORF Transcript_93372/g.302229 Transcript_93372/m.302229 type:complete len:589 (+) Transcript_93372:161-1927(+)
MTSVIEVQDEQRQQENDEEEEEEGEDRPSRFPELPPGCKEKEAKERAVGAANAFSKLHIKITVLMLACSFLAFGGLLVVEGMSVVRANEAQWVMDLSSLGKEVLFYDEELTSSARLLALTGDVRWRDLYQAGVAPLDDALGGIEDKAPYIAEDFAASTVVANGILLELESSAVELSLTNVSAATAVLFSDVYDTNKAELLKGMAILDAAISAKRRSYEETQARWGNSSVIVVVIVFVAEVLVAVGLRRIDKKLKLLTEAAEEATGEYNSVVRLRLLEQVNQAAVADIREARKKIRKIQSWKKDRPQLKRSQRRIACYGLIADLLGIAAVGIPAGLTLTSLAKAGEALSLQELLLHMQGICYYDLALTSSARLCALTGDEKWSARYDGFVAPIMEELAGLATASPELAGVFAERTAAVNEVLIAMEESSLAACTTDHSRAESIVFGIPYEQNKTALSDGLIALWSNVDELVKEYADAKELFQTTRHVLMVFCTMVVMGTDIFRVILAMSAESLLQPGEDVDVDDKAELQLMGRKLENLQLAIDEVHRLRAALPAPEGLEAGREDEEMGQAEPMEGSPGTVASDVTHISL